jgi:hypothetical protein
MNINKHPNLEDLLKVKKAEQPDDVFWEKFDRDLQEKTLQTFIEQEPWYRNLANKFSQFALSTSMACALIFLMGTALYINLSPEPDILTSDVNSQEESLMIFEEMMITEEFSDYAVEVISIQGDSETYDFEADAISVAIGDTVDYSDAPVYASSDTFRISKQYTQLASFAF